MDHRFFVICDISIWWDGFLEKYLFVREANHCRATLLPGINGYAHLFFKKTLILPAVFHIKTKKKSLGMSRMFVPKDQSQICFKVECWMGILSHTVDVGGFGTELYTYCTFLYYAISSVLSDKPFSDRWAGNKNWCK